MDIDRMAKEWPEMKRRIDALERAQSPLRSADAPAGSLREDAERLIARMEEATAVLKHADETLRAKDLDAKDE